MSRTLTVLMSLCCLLGVTLCADAQIPKKPKMIKAPVVGHRGHSAIAPENTLASVKQAVKTGANGCEIDVRLSTDGQVFLSHDDSLKRCGGVDIKVNDQTYEELLKHPVGYKEKFGDQFQDEKVPLLKDVLKELKGTKTCLVCEIKGDGTGNQQGIEKAVLDLLKEAHMVKKTIVIAFSADVCKRMRELDKSICIAWLVSKGGKESPKDFTNRVLKTLADCKINCVDMQHGAASKELVKNLHSQGVYVFVWTVDDPERMKALYEMGVDSVTTNMPDKALEVLKGMKKRH